MSEFDKEGWELPDLDWHRIHCAARDGNVEALETELKQGVNIELRTLEGYRTTPLMFAVGHDQPETTKLLLERKASVDTKNRHGETALNFCCDQPPRCAELLLDHKADIDDQSNNGNTVLLLAAFKENEAMVKLLMRRKANTGLRNDHDETPLKIATEKKNWRIVQLLLPAPEAPPAPFPSLKFSSNSDTPQAEPRNVGKKRKNDDTRDSSGRRKKKGKADNQQATSAGKDKDGDKQMEKEKS